MLIKHVASYLLNIAILVRRLCSSIALCGGKRRVNFDLLSSSSSSSSGSSRSQRRSLGS